MSKWLFGPRRISIVATWVAASSSDPTSDMVPLYPATRIWCAAGLSESRVARSRWRVRGAKVVFVAVVAARSCCCSTAIATRTSSSPFSRSTSRAPGGRHRPSDLHGQRIPIDEPWSGYDWDTLVDMAALQHPGQLRHAYMGVGATVDFLDHALDWVATHTPEDRETRYLEATVTYFENTRGPTRSCSEATSATEA